MAGIYPLEGPQPTLEDVEGIVAKYPQLRRSWSIIEGQLQQLELEYRRMVECRIIRMGAIPVTMPWEQHSWREMLIGNVFDVLYQHLYRSTPLPATYEEWKTQLLIEFRKTDATAIEVLYESLQ